MHVLMSADAVGGVWTHALDLARALVPHGVRVTLATLGPAPRPDQAKEAESIAGLDLRHVGGKLEWMDEPWDDVRESGETLLALAQDLGVDLVHLNGYAHAALPWRVPVLVGAHSCVCGWWRAVHGTPPPDAWRRYVERLDEGLRAADLVVAPTRAMLDSMREHHAMDGVDTLVVPNGRAHATAAASAVETRSTSPSTDARETVLVVGRVWDEAKDVATLDAAAEGLPWPVEVVGDPTPPSGGEAQPPVLRHARLRGRLAPDALDEAFARAAIYAHPARYEPFGLTPLEAARHGCALVLSDIPTLREVWGDAALYARPGDADAFRAALLRLIADTPLRERLGARARERAARYMPGPMARAYADAYRRLVRGHQARPEEESACAS